MGAFSLDINDLDRKMCSTAPRSTAEINKVPFIQNKGKFVKVAFDMFRSNCDDTLWELVSEDGSQFLVKRTELEQRPLAIESKTQESCVKKGFWAITYNPKESVTLHLFGIPLRQFAQEKFRYTESSKQLFAESLMETIMSDRKVAMDLILSTANRDTLLATCSANLDSNAHRSVYSWLSGANKVIGTE